MRKAFKYSSASKTVVKELAELGYLKGKHGLTNKMVRLALERLQTDLSRKATIQSRVQETMTDFSLNEPTCVTAGALPPNE
jgi:hypothetical protein